DPDLLADPVRLEQVLVNLMKNAMQAGATQLEVSWVVSADDSITVVVDDDGPGVPASIRERLFEPFFTTKSVGEGTGLGLAVVHGIIAEHGGQVEVQESPMGGARFAIRLPVNPAEESNAPSAEEGADATNV
ncbi:MAG: ATP-binding protein, partial [Ectothiorhodospiraceae bacterium]|nr:ATP-binding protein [Ectothiorhodospiraceae bacterium]